jgi:hypothetical protein
MKKNIISLVLVLCVGLTRGSLGLPLLYDVQHRLYQIYLYRLRNHSGFHRCDEDQQYELRQDRPPGWEIPDHLCAGHSTYDFTITRSESGSNIFLASSDPPFCGAIHFHRRTKYLQGSLTATQIDFTTGIITWSTVTDLQ